MGVLFERGSRVSRTLMICLLFVGFMGFAYWSYMSYMVTQYVRELAERALMDPESFGTSTYIMAVVGAVLAVLCLVAGVAWAAGVYRKEGISGFEFPTIGSSHKGGGVREKDSARPHPDNSIVLLILGMALIALFLLFLSL